VLDHEPERFGETEDGVGGLAPGILQVLDREKRPVNVVMPVDQEQLHVRNLAESPNIIMIFVGAGTPSCRREKRSSNSPKRPEGRPSPFPAMVAIRIIRY
jgi:hypothetical protein